MILAYSYLLPDRLHFVRGFCESLERFEVFKKIVLDRYQLMANEDAELTLILCRDYFRTLPHAIIVNNETFVVPGGIPDNHFPIPRLEDYDNIDRTFNHLAQISMGNGTDSCTEKQWTAFLIVNQLNFVVQSNKVPQKGYEIKGKHKRMVEICSAGNCENENHGAMICFKKTEEDRSIIITQYLPQDRDFDPSNVFTTKQKVMRNTTEETPLMGLVIHDELKELKVKFNERLSENLLVDAAKEIIGFDFDNI
jgi:hypothetical protein